MRCRFGRLLCGELNAVSNAITYTKFRSRSHDAVIRVYDGAGNVIETHEHKGDFKEPFCDLEGAKEASEETFLRPTQIRLQKAPKMS
jgi:hypothetical protein